MKILYKNDYLKIEKRTDVHVTIRSSLFEDLHILSIKWREPMGKILDCILLDLLDNPDKLNELREKVRNYR